MKNLFTYLFTIVLVLCCVTAAHAVNWIKKNSLFPSDARQSAASFVIKDKAYIGTGYIYQNYNNVYFNDFWQYDSSTATWTKIADFPGESRYEAISFSANGKGYVGLGWGKSGNLKDFYEYDPGKNTWTKIADFPDARSGASAFVINNVGYIGTGYETNLKSDFYKYESGAWKAVASLPSGEARDKATAYAFNGKGYIVSGGAGPGVFGGTDSIWEYDPVTNTWQRISYFGLASNMLKSYVSGNIPYVVLYNDLYKYELTDKRFYREGTVFNGMKDISSETFFVINDVPYMTLGTYGDFFNATNNIDMWYDADAKEFTNIKQVTADNFTVYPNPVRDYFVISGKSGSQISISDFAGRLLLTRNNISDKETIIVSGWQRGVYLLTMKKDENSVIRKLIIQ